MFFNLIRRKTLTPRKILLDLLNERIENDFHEYKFDRNVEIFLELYEFELEDQAENKFVYLRKKVGKHDLEINFEAQYQINLGQIPELKIKKTNQNVESYADFNIFITNPENNSGIYVDCSTCNKILVLNHVMYAEDMKIFNDPIASSKKYSGRELEKVKKPYLDHLVELVRNYGIDDNVLEFIEMYSSDKEYRLYMAWLVKIRDFLIKKRDKE